MDLPFHRRATPASSAPDSFRIAVLGAGEIGSTFAFQLARTGGGIPAAVESDKPLWLRCHAPLCVGFESVSLAAMQCGSEASWREARALARGVHAAFRRIEVLGIPVYPRSKRRLYRSPDAIVAAMLWELSRVRPFRELLATGGHMRRGWWRPWSRPRRPGARTLSARSKPLIPAVGGEFDPFIHKLIFFSSKFRSQRL